MFSTEPNVPPKPKEKSWYEKFSSQPHQPFFSNGIIFLILFIAALFLHYSNTVLLEVPLHTFHVYAMIFVVFIQFFLGFLFVVFPRFLMQAEIEPKVYMQQFMFYFVGTVLFFISIFTSLALSMLASFILFVAQLMSFKLLYSIHKKSLMKDKNDTKWVLISYAVGLVAHFLFILSFIGFEHELLVKKVALNTGFYLFIFLVIFTISQRMVPFFTSVKYQGYVINKSKALMEIVFALLTLKVIILTFESPALNLIADIPLLFVFTKELIKWKLPFTKLPPIMWVLFLSLYWIPVGFGFSVLESIAFIISGGELVFEKSVVHIFAIGYFTTILVGFGTRVVLGHSGRTPTADKITTFMFLFIQLIVISRLFAAYSINLNLDYVFWINLSAVLFIVAFVAWSIKYLGILLEGK